MPVYLTPENIPSSFGVFTVDEISHMASECEAMEGKYYERLTKAGVPLKDLDIIHRAFSRVFCSSEYVWIAYLGEKEGLKFGYAALNKNGVKLVKTRLVAGITAFLKETHSHAWSEESLKKLNEAISRNVQHLIPVINDDLSFTVRKDIYKVYNICSAESCMSGCYAPKFYEHNNDRFSVVAITDKLDPDDLSYTPDIIGRALLTLTDSGITVLDRVYVHDDYDLEETRRAAERWATAQGYKIRNYITDSNVHETVTVKPYHTYPYVDTWGFGVLTEIDGEEKIILANKVQTLTNLGYTRELVAHLYSQDGADMFADEHYITCSVTNIRFRVGYACFLIDSSGYGSYNRDYVAVHPSVVARTEEDVATGNFQYVQFENTRNKALPIEEAVLTEYRGKKFYTTKKGARQYAELEAQRKRETLDRERCIARGYF